MPHVPQTSKLVAEFVGTFLLVFTVGCNVLSGNAVWGGISIASVLMVSIYALGGISGANFNPAVSFSLGVLECLGGQGLPWFTVLTYACVQAMAGISAGFIYTALFQNSFNLTPVSGFTAFEAGLCEMLYTFMLCFVVLNVAAARKCETSPNQFYGLAIGFVVVAGAYGAGAVSGGCFNPAVAIGIDTSSYSMGFGWCIAYTVFELLGAVLAAFLFKVVRPEDFTSDTIPKRMSSKLTSEFLGTYMLVLTVGLNVLGKSKAAPYSIAASLMCMIYALGDISGAHFNPAVTLAVLVSGLDPDFNSTTAIFYTLVQIAAGLCSALTYSMVYLSQTVAPSFALGPSKNNTMYEVAVAEVIFTFFLCFVVLAVAVSKTTKSQQMFGFAIGSCVTVGGFAIGGISGGSLNPAVSFGIAFSHIMFGNGGLYAAVLYTLFELIGGASAGAMIGITHATSASPGDDKP